MVDAGEVGYEYNQRKFYVLTDADIDFDLDYIKIDETGAYGPSNTPYAFAPSPSDGASDVPIDANLSWSQGADANSHNVYLGTTSPGTFQGNQAGTTFDPNGLLTRGTTYYWRIDEVNDGGVTSTGSVWSFSTNAGLATTPIPDANAVDVNRNKDLGWTAALGALSHNVYFGTASPGASQGNQAGTTFDPGTMVSGQTYYWRIDEIDAFGTVTGDVWSFTAEDYIILETFNLYADTNSLQAVWDTNGVLETTKAHDSNSMKVDYTAAIEVSRAVNDLDWSDLEVLSLWFKGDVNVGSLSVTLNGAYTLTDANALNDKNADVNVVSGAWQQMIFELDDFGMDLTDVNKITLGITPASSGTVYFDDIEVGIAPMPGPLNSEDFNNTLGELSDDLSSRTNYKEYWGFEGDVGLGSPVDNESDAFKITGPGDDPFSMEFTSAGGIMTWTQVGNVNSATIAYFRAPYRFDYLRTFGLDVFGEGYTVEYRMKINTLSGGLDVPHMQFVFMDGIHMYYIDHKQNGDIIVRDPVNGNQTVSGSHMDGEFHKYRLAHTYADPNDLTKRKASFYEDGSPLAENFCGYLSGDFSEMSIDLSFRSDATVDAEFDYLRIDAPEPAAEDPNFAKNWIRSRPFQVMAAAIGGTEGNPGFDVAEYLAAGLNTVWANQSSADDVAEAAAAAGEPWQGMLGTGTEDERYHGTQLSNLDAFISNAGCIGWWLPDEPDTSTAAVQNAFRNMAEWVKWRNPSFLTVLSQGSIHAGLDVIKPDAVTVNSYPFMDTSFHIDAFFNSYMDNRNRAVANDILYWGWAQSFDDPDPCGLPQRIPTESELRFNVFSMLTMGYTGINYFVYDEQGLLGFFDTNGDPRAHYAYAASANPEVITLGRALRYLDSNDVRCVRMTYDVTGVTGTVAYPTLPDWSSGAGGHTQINDVNVDISDMNNYGPRKDGMIGFFTDDAGEKYFMLTNIYAGGPVNDLSADAAKLPFYIQFDVTVDELYELNRITGEVDRITLTGNRLDVTLPGGTGALYKYASDGAGVFLSADLDDDGDVDLTDFATFQTRWQDDTCNVPDRWCGHADLDEDEAVGFDDLRLFSSQFLLEE